jgi:hypothetical protein
VLLQVQRLELQVLLVLGQELLLELVLLLELLMLLRQLLLLQLHRQCH